MENENKDKVVLNEEELKEVAGGAPLDYLKSCLSINDRKPCEAKKYCRWDENQNKCLPKFE